MNHKFILLLIVVLGIFLRLYRLGEIPVGFHRDEAFLGYNAYSILKTGKEMTGETLPVHLRSFLYSPAGYSYAAIPTIAAFGLTPFAVRLPSAIAGILTIIAVYFLAHKLMKEIALPSAAILAISPWHINLSRTATENTVVVLLLTIGLYVYLVYLQNKRFIYFFGSMILFASTYFFYQAPRAFVPLLVPILLAFGWKQIKTDRMRVGIVTILFIFIPIALIVRSPNLSLRIRTVSIFASRETQLTLDESLHEDSIAKVNPLVTRLFHNKLTAYISTISDNYFQHFSYDFLLTDKGLPDRYRVPGSGIMYPLELLFALLGAVIILIKNPRLAFLLLGWIAIAPLGSSLTSDDVPNLQRTLLVFPALTVVSAFGAYNMKKMLPITTLWLLYSLSSYLHAYYVQQVYHRAWYRHEGYEKLVVEVNRLLPRYSKAVITNHESSPTIFFLFYNRTDPTLIQDVWNRDTRADLNTLSFDRYEFSKEACPALAGEPNVLYVNFSDCKVTTPRIREVSAIKRRDETTVFRLLEVQP